MKLWDGEERVWNSRWRSKVSGKLNFLWVQLIIFYDSFFCWFSSFLLLADFGKKSHLSVDLINSLYTVNYNPKFSNKIPLFNCYYNLFSYIHILSSSCVVVDDGSSKNLDPIKDPDTSVKHLLIFSRIDLQVLVKVNLQLFFFFFCDFRWQ